MTIWIQIADTHFFDPLRVLWKLKFWKLQISVSEKLVRVIYLHFLMMKLITLSLSIYNCNTSSFVTSGSKLRKKFWKLNLRKELNLSQILLEVYETLQLYSACQNKQKSQRWPPSIFCSFRDKNPRSLRRLIFTKNTNMNGNLFLLHIPF